MGVIREFLGAAYPWVLMGTALAVTITVINEYRKKAD